MDETSETGLVVDELWRYPVKSLGGERLAEGAVGPLGLDGDRRWGICDTETGRVLTGRRAPDLLLARARHLGPGRVEIVLPDGSTPTTDADLSDWLGRPVALRPSSSEAVEFEVPDPDEQDWGSYGAADGAWHDSARTRLSLVSRETVAGWDPRRFRSNVLLGGQGEDALVGATVELGTASLTVTKRVSRCVMVNRPLPDLDADRSVLRTILDQREGTLAIGATVLVPGTIAESDPLRLRRRPGAGGTSHP